MTFSEIWLIYFHKLFSWFQAQGDLAVNFFFFNFSFSKRSRTFLLTNPSLYVGQQCLFLDLMWNLPKMTLELRSQRTIFNLSPLCQKETNWLFFTATDLKHNASRCRKEREYDSQHHSSHMIHSIHSSPTLGKAPGTTCPSLVPWLFPYWKELN